MTQTTVRVGMDAWVDEALPNHGNPQTRRLKLDGAGVDQKRAFLHFRIPFTPGDDVDVSEATLYVRLAGTWSGSHVLTAYRVVESWSARSVKWANAPDTAGAAYSVTVTDGQDGDEVQIDVTGMIGWVSSGDAPWYGLRLELGSGGPFDLWGSEAFDVDWRPKLHVTWSERPDTPTLLSPSDGQVVSKAYPNLGWDNPGYRGETTQAKARVQVSTTNTTDGITWDSTLVTLTQSEMNLEDPPAGTPGVPSIPNGETRYWRVMYEDDSGRSSDWSPFAAFVRQTKGTVTIDNPVDGATVEDLTSTVIIGFTGATLESLAVWLDKIDVDGVTWVELWRFPRTVWVGTDYWVWIPPGFIRRTDDQYRVRARVWDGEDRATRPGDPAWVEAISLFTWDRNGVVDPVDSLTVSQADSGSPLVDVVWTDDDAPDYYSLTVDGDHHYPRIAPADVVSGVGEYTFVFDKAIPMRTMTYEVERVLQVSGDLKHSKANPTVSYRSDPLGIWLWDRDDISSQVVLFGPDHGANFDWGEVAGLFYPAGAPKHPAGPVRLLQSTRGREGTVSGAIRDNGGVKARTYLDRLRRIWQQNREVRLVMGEISVPVVIGEPKESPLSETPPAYQVSFTAIQVGEF